MISRLFHLTKAIRRRFRILHLTVALPQEPILNALKETVGYFDAIEIAQGQLRVSGWVRDCSRVELFLAGMHAETVPNLHREDVAAATGSKPNVGFQLSLPITNEAIRGEDVAGLVFGMSDPTLPAIAPVSLHFLNLKRKLRRLDLRLAKAMTVSALPAANWMITGHQAAKHKVITRLGFNAENLMVRQTLDETVFVGAPQPAPYQDEITIVLPIYNAFDLLPDVIDRILANTDVPFHLIAINDASPDTQVWPWLQNRLGALTAQEGQRITLLENPENLGFILTVNRGLDLALADTDATGPVVLFNSDAFVPSGWAARLVRPLIDDPQVATATPMSNDAEIFSIPQICAKSDLGSDDVDSIDAAARALNGKTRSVDVPTGVGFCMAMSRDWLRRVGDLDPGFGRGYGEEVDWCQRARALGGRHIAVRNLFVEHRGGSSFGSADKLALITKNNAVISKRYPGYDAEVQQFIRSDPMLTERLALGVVWAGQQAKQHAEALPVYLAHSMGGGAEMHLGRQIAQDIETLGGAVVLRVGGVSRWAIELHTRDGVTSGVTQNSDLVRRILAGAGARHIHYSCGVGDLDPQDIPAFLLGLLGEDDTLTVMVHDFFMISPSYTLIGADHLYAGPPNGDDPTHTWTASDGAHITLAQWQDNWGSLIDASDRIEVFSHDSAAHLRAAYPNAARKIDVQPHNLIKTPRRIERDAQAHDGLHFGVLGGINRAKGAAVVQELANRIAAGDLNAKLTVIGEVDPTVPLPPPATIHGRYAPDMVSDLAQHYGVTHWLIPSVWPETFSFTTHEVLATGLPVLTFDLGAQAEAAKRAPNGTVIQYRAQDGSVSVHQLVDNLVDTVQSMSLNTRSEEHDGPRKNQN